MRNAPRTRKRQIVSSLIILVAIFALAWVAVKLQTNQSTEASIIGVPYVIDGDTLNINQQRVRLVGIDAPELDQSCTLEGSSAQCGHIARSKLQSKIGKQSVTCEITGRDQYNRPLGRCLLADVDLNEWMVREGWAVSYGKYTAAESDARNSQRGLWAGNFERPHQWRQAHKNDIFDNNNNGLLNIIDVIFKEIGAWIDRIINAILDFIGR